MLQMLRTTTAKIADARQRVPARRRASPCSDYMCYRDGRPFMVVNAPTLDHARFIVAGFSSEHTWMLVELGG
jgi:hypothetical protein